MTGETIRSLPEVRGGSKDTSRVRIAPSMDVPLTARARRLLDCSPMRRLASLSQLGLVSLVYPGATHTRLEHSLGVYGNAISLLKHLTERISIFHSDIVNLKDDVAAEAFLVAAMLHDAGHWPFAHAIEDMGPMGKSKLHHEDRVETLLNDGPIADAIQQDWQCNADDVMAILRPQSIDRRIQDGTCRLRRNDVYFYASCLSGPIDIDKLDYLQRDSLHAGVPYGRNFDPERLLASMCPHPTEPKLALGSKARTAAEMMVFGRYVMFSEVYWHHAVRSATAMLQRSLFELHQVSPEVWVSWSDRSDTPWIERYKKHIESIQRQDLVRLSDGLFGSTRGLFKRVAEYNVESNPHMHSQLARRPYYWLANASIPLAQSLSDAVGFPVAPSNVLIDAPPVKLEVDINLDIVQPNGTVCSLGDVSPVASVLANRQFDNHVKRVRVYVPAEVREVLRAKRVDKMADWLADAVEQTESNWA